MKQQISFFEEIFCRFFSPSKLNFTNILRSSFVLFFAQNINCKLIKNCFCTKKAARNMQGT